MIDFSSLLFTTTFLLLTYLLRKTGMPDSNLWQISYLTLFQPGRADYFHLLLLASPIFFPLLASLIQMQVIQIRLNDRPRISIGYICPKLQYIEDINRKFDLFNYVALVEQTKLHSILLNHNLAL